MAFTIDELKGSISDLENIGLDRPTLLAYPHGEFNSIVIREVRRAGVHAAFTVEPGLAYHGQNPFRIPRLEIMRRDVGWRFLLKVTLAGKSLLQFIRDLLFASTVRTGPLDFEILDVKSMAEDE